MAKIISIHSFRHAAGCSTLTANLAVLLAGQGKRVAAIDTHFQTPCLHLFFNIPEADIKYTLNSYLLKRSAIEQAICDVSELSGLGAPGRLFLLPSSPIVGDILPMLRHEYDLEKLDGAAHQLSQTLSLDYLLLDCPSGLDQDTLVLMALSDIRVLVLHPAAGDFQGGAVMMDVANRLGESGLRLVLNDVPESLDSAQAREAVESAFHYPVAALLPHSEPLMLLASRGVLADSNPDDLYVTGLKQLLNTL